MPDATVTYLVHNEIFIVRLETASRRVEQIESWRLPENGTRVTYAGLTCGRDGTVLLHRSQLNHQRSGVYSELITADICSRTIQAIPESMGLTWPVLSPSGHWIAASGTIQPYRGVHSIVVFSTMTGERRTFTYERDAAAHAWEDTDAALLLTALSSSKGGLDTIQLDLNSGSFAYLAPGGRAVRSGQTGLLATISSDQRSIEVRDLAGAVRCCFRCPLLRDIAQWIDRDRLLYTSAVAPYRDTLGIADVETGKLHKYVLPSHGEISGASFQIRPAA